MATRDFYEVLGVSSNATEDQIKKAYRKLARQYHPDQVHGTGKEKEAAEARFKEISGAYDTLSDPDKRKTYDQMRQFGGAGGFQGHTGPFGGGTGPFGRAGKRGPFGQGSPFGQSTGFGGVGFEDILSSLFGGADTYQPTQAPRAEAAETGVEITLEEAFHGTTREVTNPRTSKRLRVKIPAGVTTGSKVRAGDALVTVTVQPHALFHRKGDDLELELPLTFWEAIDGAEVEVPTLDGLIKMKIPPRTQSGRLFRLKGKGMPHLKGEGRGDLFVKALIHLPPDIDEQALALWRRLGTMTPYDPRASMRAHAPH
ncbi:MAG TPA: J domain-containing protein [Stenomitos sp.]